MLQLKIISNRDFIKQLFLSDAFDSFLLEEATITMANTFYIEGRIHKNFYSEEEYAQDALLTKEFKTWKSLRSICFDLIKGKKPPLSFKIVLHYAFMEEFTLPNVKSFVLTIRFDGSFVYLTTGISFHTFEMDKTPEQIWDHYLLNILSQKEITYELDS